VAKLRNLCLGCLWQTGRPDWAIFILLGDLLRVFFENYKSSRNFQDMFSTVKVMYYFILARQWLGIYFGCFKKKKLIWSP
jgi:hypothetical protein